MSRLAEMAKCVVFLTDTLSVCYFFDFPVPLKETHVKAKYNDDPSFYFACITLVGTVSDTIFNKVVIAKNCKHYLIYEYDDFENIHGTFDLWLDTDKEILLQLSYYSNNYADDEYPRETKIESVKPVSAEYFESLWNQASDNIFRCNSCY